MKGVVELDTERDFDRDMLCDVVFVPVLEIVGVSPLCDIDGDMDFDRVCDGDIVIEYDRDNVIGFENVISFVADFVFVFDNVVNVYDVDDEIEFEIVVENESVTNLDNVISLVFVI